MPVNYFMGYSVVLLTTKLEAVLWSNVQYTQRLQATIGDRMITLHFSIRVFRFFVRLIRKARLEFSTKAFLVAASVTHSRLSELASSPLFSVLAHEYSSLLLLHFGLSANNFPILVCFQAFHCVPHASPIPKWSPALGQTLARVLTKLYSYFWRSSVLERQSPELVRLFHTASRCFTRLHAAVAAVCCVPDSKIASFVARQCYILSPCVPKGCGHLLFSDVFNFLSRHSRPSPASVETHFQWRFSSSAAFLMGSPRPATQAPKQLQMCHLCGISLYDCEGNMLTTPNK